MNRLLCGAIVGLMLVLCPSLDAGQLESGGPRLTVCVYNLARISDSILSLAKSETLQIFRDSGIDLIWLDTVNIEEAPLDPRACPTLILSRARGAKTSPNAYGTTVKGRSAWVFYDRVESLVATPGSPLWLHRFGVKAQVLSVVIAHEIGHLMGLSHFETGIMKATLSAGTFFETRRQPFFTAEQSQQLRASVNGTAGN